MIGSEIVYSGTKNPFTPNPKKCSKKKILYSQKKNLQTRATLPLRTRKPKPPATVTHANHVPTRPLYRAVHRVYPLPACTYPMQSVPTSQPPVYIYISIFYRLEPACTACLCACLECLFPRWLCECGTLFSSFLTSRLLLPLPNCGPTTHFALSQTGA